MKYISKKKIFIINHISCESSYISLVVLDVSIDVVILVINICTVIMKKLNINIEKIFENVELLLTQRCIGVNLAYLM